LVLDCTSNQESISDTKAGPAASVSTRTVTNAPIDSVIGLPSTSAVNEIENGNGKTVESVTSEINSSDKASFSEPLTYDDKQLIISLGPCQPSEPFPRDPAQKGR
jgi:hypothetical protein